MIQFVTGVCRQHPQVAIFLALAVGYFVGKIKVFKFSLGSTAGVLLTALVLGQMRIDVPDLLQTIGFALFIFTIGYKVGPQFFGALKKEGIHYIYLSLVVAVTALLTAVGLSRFFGFDPGTAAGLMAGALTESTIVGTADGAINNLALSAAQKQLWLGNVAIAYAITYIFGTAGRIVFFKLAPRLMGLSLKAESKKLEAEMSGGADSSSDPSLFSWYKQVGLRAFRLEQGGSTVAQIERSFPGQAVVENIDRQGQLLDSKPDLRLESGDILAIAAIASVLSQGAKLVGPEVDDKAACDLLGEILNVCVLKPDVVGQTLGQLGRRFGGGIYLRKMTRQGHELPLTRDTVVHKCDVLTIAGSQKVIDSAVKQVGYAERPTSASDLIMIGLGCVFGTLIGLVSIPVLGVPVTLGVGGGVLVAGLVCGWLRSVHPTFGQIPGGAQWILTDLGLNLFIACLGLSAGPKALHALQTTGGSVFLAGVVLSLVPMIAGLLYGRWVLKLNPVLLLGALTGAGVITAALNTLKEDADSPAPALGYAVPYAFNNVILTVWGSLIVHIFAR
ncbi:MAG: aspartate-alanine antiporter [Candidatus Saganbacteria bacterium]|nr:aspartate-alanine antiporter [Candidatus Saganbacteria bacterium]